MQGTHADRPGFLAPLPPRGGGVGGEGVFAQPPRLPQTPPPPLPNPLPRGERGHASFLFMDGEWRAAPWMNAATPLQGCAA